MSVAALAVEEEPVMPPRMLVRASLAEVVDVDLVVSLLAVVFFTTLLRMSLSCAFIVVGMMSATIATRAVLRMFFFIMMVGLMS